MMAWLFVEEMIFVAPFMQVDFLSWIKIVSITTPLMLEIFNLRLYNKYMIKKEIIVENDKKIVTLLQDYGFSFADVNKMMKNKDVKINSKPTKENVMVFVGDLVTVFYPDNMFSKKYEMVYDDDDCCVVYKYSGIETAGDKGLEAVIGNVIAVHRLDRNTEGLVVFAKNEIVEKRLLSAFKNHEVQKKYMAEVVGEFVCEKMIFKAFLKKDADNSLVEIFKNKVSGASEILTEVRTIKAGKQSSLLEVGLITGKTHQIRAHLAFLGHPILGDGKYGKNEINKKFGFKRQKLACFKLKFGFLGIKGLDFKEFVRYPEWYNEEK